MHDRFQKSCHASRAYQTADFGTLSDPLDCLTAAGWAGSLRMSQRAQAFRTSVASLYDGFIVAAAVG